MKLITFAVPCYNSAEYMRRCVDSLLPGGEDVEIILVNDGSTDDTGRIADEYQQRYPDIVTAIHQENGGHGEGVNQGIRNAKGLYLKIVDSDDWIDSEGLQKLLSVLRDRHSRGEAPIDMYVANYVYDHISDTQRVIRYRNVFPVDRVSTWDEMGHFRVSQYLIMHAIVYRTQLLREMHIELPKHTFYVDTIYVYTPLPGVKTIYYMDVNLYHYYTGREDQSVNEQIMVRRIDQQLRVARVLIHAYDLDVIERSQPRLYQYMVHLLGMVLAISSIMLMLKDTDESRAEIREIWTELKSVNARQYRRVRYTTIGVISKFRGKRRGRLIIKAYRLMKKHYKFN